MQRYRSAIKRHDLSGQAARRTETLRRQKQRRVDSASRARKLAEVDDGGGGEAAAAAAAAAPAPEPEEAPVAAQGAMDVAAAKGGGGARRRRRAMVDLCRTELMMPEWMLAVPSDLGQRWVVAARPSGRRCLVVCSKGRTVVKQRNGSRADVFSSGFPGGGRGASSTGGDHTILDCILAEESGVYVVVDLMCWNGQALYDCNAEFRLFWAQSKLDEVSAGAVTAEHQRPFVPLGWYCADGAGMQASYGVTSEQLGFTKDGLLFVCLDGHYCVGVSPLSLLWKDSSCSPWFIETRSQGAEQMATVVLGAAAGLRGCSALLTCDEPPVQAGQLAAETVASEGLQPGEPLQVAVASLTIDAGGRATGATLQFRSRCGRARSGGDSWSKLLFQYAARTQPLQYAELVATAAQAPPPVAAVAEAAAGGGASDMADAPDE